LVDPSQKGFERRVQANAPGAHLPRRGMPAGMMRRKAHNAPQKNRLFLKKAGPRRRNEGLSYEAMLRRFARRQRKYPARISSEATEPRGDASPIGSNDSGNLMLK
jgi:hypothetical protein